GGLSPNTTSKGFGRRGSTKISRLPPLGQEVASVSSPGWRVSDEAVSGTIRTRRGVPSARAFSASRRTSGSEQLPPIHPRNRPSAGGNPLSPPPAPGGAPPRTAPGPPP